MKTIVITGASSGIGLVTAEFLAKKGYKVYGLSRNKGESELINYIVCDVSKKAQVNDAFKQISEDINYVINNAGVGISGAIEYASTEDIHKIIDVNIMGVVNVSQVAIPYLRKTKGRIINIGSVAGELTIPFQTFYSVTKAAVNIITEGLYMELKPFGIKVTNVMPGDTKTTFTNNRKKTEIFDELYHGRINNSIAKMEKDEQNGRNPVSVSKVIYKVMKKPRPPLKVTVGFEYKLIVFLKKILPNSFVNYILYKMYASEK